MNELTGVEIAELAGVTKNAVYKAGLPKTKSGKYSPSDPAVAAYIQGASKLARKQRIQKRDTSNLSMEELEHEELEWKIRVLQARYEEKDIKNAEIKKRLIPAELFDMALGTFASAIRTNILNIGNRVARGDTDLRDRIEREIQAGIERTIEHAKHAITTNIDRAIDELASAPEDVEDDD